MFHKRRYAIACLQTAQRGNIAGQVVLGQMMNTIAFGDKNLKLPAGPGGKSPRNTLHRSRNAIKIAPFCYIEFRGERKRQCSKSKNDSEKQTHCRQVACSRFAFRAHVFELYEGLCERPEESGRLYLNY